MVRQFDANEGRESVLAEGYWDILQNSEGDFMFCVQTRDGEPEEPEITYSGGESAWFRRRPDQIIQLDAVNKDIRADLLTAAEVLIAEFNPRADGKKSYLPDDIKQGLDGMVREYTVPLRHDPMEMRFQEAGVFYQSGRYDEALPLLRALADEGFARAQTMIGLCFLQGQGVEENEAAAVEWFGKAAGQGHSDAQHALGMCHYFGQGVDQDFAAAIEWFGKAADQGNPRAQNMLGDCYFHGRGIKQDFMKGIELYIKAAEGGDDDARTMLDKLKAEGAIHGDI